MRILVIDDEEYIQRIISAFLLRFGQDYHVQMDVRAIHDSTQALHELVTNGNRYDLVLLDVRMPKVSGNDIYNTITLTHPELLDKVVIVTGYPNDLKCSLLDKLNILEKPFHYRELAKKICTINGLQPKTAHIGI